MTMSVTNHRAPDTTGGRSVPARSPRGNIVPSDIPALLDGQYLDLVIGHQNYISRGLAD